MGKYVSFLFVFALLKGTSPLLAQDSSVANLFRVDYETPLTIELSQRETSDEPLEPIKKKEKRKNPKIFYGIKTKRGFTKTGYGKNTAVETFYYLKEKDYVGPDEYTREFYYYDFKRKKIVNSIRVKDPKNVGVLHGPYVKKIGEQVIESGMYYKGKKHRRWVQLNTSDILVGKQIYWKGWPEESMLGFYDFERQHLREVIPVHFGERNGMYYAFHPNGAVAAVGEYKYDKRIGTWREYYPNKRLKREIQYPADPFDKTTLPVITKEWAENGTLIFDRVRFYNGAG